VASLREFAVALKFLGFEAVGRGRGIHAGQQKRSI
jgi:hypothetical protein